MLQIKHKDVHDHIVEDVDVIETISDELWLYLIARRVGPVYSQIMRDVNRWNGFVEKQERFLTDD
jgi:hypothetical protein